MPAIENTEVRYETTVRAQYYCLINSYDENGHPVYDEKVYKNEALVNVKPATTAPTLDIWASGKRYDQLMKRKLTALEVTAIGMPKEIFNPAQGIETSGGFAFEKERPERKHFAWGYVVDFDDGTQGFRWYADCVMGQFDGESKTETADLNEPSNVYTFSAVPHYGNTKTDYFTGDVADGETALTEEQFFTAPILRKEDIPTQA